jgi:hypothetical protein
MFNLKYECNQPIFYLGSALTSLSAITVHLSKQHKAGKMTFTHMLVMLVIYALIIYAISRLINWCCRKKYNNVAWLIALLPIIGVLVTAFD